MKNNFSKVLLFLLLIPFVLGIIIVIKHNPHAISSLIAALFSLFLTFFVYSKDKKNPINIIFACFCFSMGIFELALFGLYIVHNISILNYWIKFFRIGYVMVAPCFLHFVLRLVKNENKTKENVLRFVYGVAIVFYVINWFGFFEKGFIKKVEFKYSPEVTQVYFVFLGYIIIVTAYSLYEVFKGYKKSNSITTRNQLKYVLLAGIVAIILGYTNALLYFGMKIYPLGWLGPIAFTSIIAYAILKHQLMDINVVIRKGVVYGTLTLSIIGIYALTVGIFTSIFDMNNITQNKPWLIIINGLTGMIVAVMFLPIKNKIQSIVDKLFFKDKYDYYETLKTLSGDLTTIFELNKLLDLLITKVTETMHIDKGYIMLFDTDKDRFLVKFSKGIDSKTLKQIKLNKTDTLVVWLEKNKTILILDESINNFEELKAQNIYLSIPLMSKNKLIGIFNLGTKLSEDTYTTEDLKLLTTISNQAAIAIENAQLSTEMRVLEKSLLHTDKLAALGVLASSITHEVKNPLVLVKTFCQLVPRRYNEMDFINRFSDAVPKAIERMEHTLGQLLDFGKLPELGFGEINVNNILDNLLDLLHYEMFKQNVNIIRQYDDKLPLIMAAEEQIKQVFMNLILNAIQAMPNGGTITITTEAESGKWEVGSGNLEAKEGSTTPYVNISVKDNGCGISDEFMSKIFKPFYTTKVRGSGLGLSISSRIIKEHKGTIELSSKLNEGTIFTVKLPVKQI
ncbi:MAG: ATP-binding protein [Elusimicrobia bacterium]|nr:ATP-binding protein [Elusimicrobiota bacterium]